MPVSPTATHCTPKRVRTRSSSTSRPSELAISTRRRVGVRGADLADGVALGACGVIGPLEHLGLAGLPHRLGQLAHLVRTPNRLALERDDTGLAGRALGCRRGGIGRVAEPVLAEVGGVGVAGGLAPDHADPGAPFTSGGEFLDLAVVEPRRRQAAVFGEHLGEVAAVPERRLERALKNRLFDQHCLLRGCLS